MSHYSDTYLTLTAPDGWVSRAQIEAEDRDVLRDKMVAAFERLQTAMEFADDQVDEIARLGCECRTTHMVQILDAAANKLMERAQ